MINYIFFFVFCCFALASSIKYKKYVHSTDPDAKCLDGTPPAIYVHQGLDKDNILIFVEGGGFCQGQTQADTIQQCYQRSKTLLGSSSLWPDQLEGQGYLSTNPNQNAFANWTKFIIAYCDGSLHQGYRSQPIKYKNSSLYFKGSKIMKSQFTWIQKNYQLTKAKKVVWTGGSAGAIATYLWSNYIRKFLQPTQKLYHIVDSGIFIDFPSHATNIHHFSIQLKNLYRISNIEQSTPLEICNIFYNGDEWKCLLIQYNYQFLVGNFLFLNSQYDSWSIPNILRIHCLQASITGSGATLAKCNKAQIESIEKYRDMYQKVIFDILQITNKNSCWSIACSNHVYACLTTNYDSRRQRVPENGVSVKDIIQDFVLKQKQRVVSMDLLPWPTNRACSF